MTDYPRSDIIHPPISSEEMQEALLSRTSSGRVISES